MAAHNELGQRGEQLARQHLINAGYRVVEQNWRWKKAEIDLIAWWEDVLIFVEVKTRSTAAFGNPEAFVTGRKKKRTAQAAAVYMQTIGHNWEVRFDVISVLIQDEDRYSLKHYEDAFFPGLFGSG